MITYLMSPSRRSGFRKIIATSLFFSVFSAAGAFASGSEGFGGAETGATQLYGAGKRVVAKQITCKKCPLAGKKLNKASAAELMDGKGMGASVIPTLSTKEKEALAVYLTRRYKL